MTGAKFLTCTNSPNAELALQNCVYVNPIDAGSAYVNIGNFVYRAVPHPEVTRGFVAMNAIQRRMAKTIPGTPVPIWDFGVPVMRNFTIDAVTIEAQFLKPSNQRIPDLTSFANSVRSALVGDVLTFGQSIVIKYLDQNILLWVKSDVRGLVTNTTEVGIDWRNDEM